MQDAPKYLAYRKMLIQFAASQHTNLDPPARNQSRQCSGRDEIQYRQGHLKQLHQVSSDRMTNTAENRQGSLTVSNASF